MPADISPPSDALLDGEGPRAYAIGMPPSLVALASAAATARRLGFNNLLAMESGPAAPAGPDDATLIGFIRAARHEGLNAHTAITIDRIACDHPLVMDAPAGSFGTPPPAPALIVDPRRPVERVRGVVRLRRPGCPFVQAWWRKQLARLHDLGFDGFALVDVDAAGSALAQTLKRAGYRIELFHSNVTKPPHHGNVLIGGRPKPDDAALRADIAVAALSQGWAITAQATAAAEAALRWLNDAHRGLGGGVSLRTWTGPGAALEIMSRHTGAGGLVLVRNRTAEPVAWPPQWMPPLPWQDISVIPGFGLGRDCIPAWQTVLFHARSIAPVIVNSVINTQAATDPARRVVISRLSPSVDAGAFAVKTVVGDIIEVEADIFADGHEKLAASVLTRAADESDWTAHPMRAVVNDIWQAKIRFSRIGRHEMLVQAWLDEWGGFVRDLARKRDAGQDLNLELREARALIEAALEHAMPAAAASLAQTLAALDLADSAQAADIALDEKLAVVMHDAAERRFLARSFVQPVEVERQAARFSSWYEMFPRSQSGDRQRHGTFADVLARLPHLAAMGFDTLYFPPIHPIGVRNRKGPNNSLQAGPGDWGSPYAIGSAEGGHDAIHAALGTPADFRDLVTAAARQGIEIALDFAIQCAPDHPWLAAHPGWFAWRPDGSIKYAENPPKKYQDIVNVSFYAEGAIPELWLALRDVVLFWIAQGVKTFRVDNPHTKPLPFWQWMIGDVKARHPEAIFLSEAFTRPKPMYHLAKVGFSQSYTYFTWRNDKAALTDYFTELTQTAVRDYFRPHLFVNTPDINPIFLQHSGRPGFLIRAALATTLSGLWGMYAGFELCEAAPLPGREEYLDSEKYELRPRPDRTSGDIVTEITQLNRLRRQEPALQTHLDLSFHNAFNENVLYYAKTAPGHLDRLLVAVSLDPRGAQEADFEIPLWLFDLPDTASVAVENLLTGRHFTWTGKMQRVRLEPERPYAIWRISKAAEAAADV